MAQRISNPAIQHFDKDTGSPLSGGQLFFFEINSTTPKDTFIDEEATTANTNPVILDATGLEPDIFGEGSYRVVLQNATDVQQWERDPVNFETSGGQFEDWLSSVDYQVNDIVEGSDSVFYISIQTPNLGNDPTGGLNTAFWSSFALIGGSIPDWLSTFTYAQNAIVRGSDGDLYSSIQGSNLGNDPTGSPTFWIEFDLLKRWNTTETFDSGDPITYNDATFISLTSSNQGNQPDISNTEWRRTGGQFRGTLIYATTANTQILTAAFVALDIFDTEQYDTDSIWASSPNPTRLTVPTGVTKVKVIANIQVNVSGATTGNVTLIMAKNGDTVQLNLPGAPSVGKPYDAFDTSNFMNSGVQEVIAGDYFEMYGVETTDGTVTASGSPTGLFPASMFAMEILE